MIFQSLVKFLQTSHKHYSSKTWTSQKDPSHLLNCRTRSLARFEVEEVVSSSVLVVGELAGGDRVVAEHQEALAHLLVASVCPAATRG
jgi:hypothetical protein